MAPRKLLTAVGTVLLAAPLACTMPRAPTNDGAPRDPDPAVDVAAKTCSQNYVCMWEDPGYNGSRYVRQYKTSGYYVIDWWDGGNEISSVKNYTGKCVRLYDDDDHSGDSYEIHKNVREISNLEEVGFDNDAESYRIYSCD